jgi:hypothetical protein
MSKKQRTYVNLVGSSTPAPSRKRKKVVAKAKSRRGSKAGGTKARGSARSSR